MLTIAHLHVALTTPAISCMWPQRGTAMVVAPAPPAPPPPTVSAAGFPRCEAETLQYRADEKMRNQVAAALRLLAGSAQTQIKLEPLCTKPGGGILRKIFEQAISEHELDMLSAQQKLTVLDEFATQANGSA